MLKLAAMQREFLTVSPYLVAVKTTRTSIHRQLKTTLIIVIACCQLEAPPSGCLGILKRLNRNVQSPLWFSYIGTNI